MVWNQISSLYNFKRFGKIWKDFFQQNGYSSTFILKEKEHIVVAQSYWRVTCPTAPLTPKFQGPCHEHLEIHNCCKLHCFYVIFHKNIKFISSVKWIQTALQLAQRPIHKKENMFSTLITFPIKSMILCINFETK